VPPEPPYFFLRWITFRRDYLDSNRAFVLMFC